MKNLLLIIALILSVTAISQTKNIPFSYSTKSVSVSGNWEQPSVYGVNDGECHIVATGGTGDFGYKLFLPNGTYLYSVNGDFYGLGCGYHYFAVEDFNIWWCNIYPETLLIYPGSAPLLLYTTPITPNTTSHNFGSNHNKTQ